MLNLLVCGLLLSPAESAQTRLDALRTEFALRGTDEAERELLAIAREASETPAAGDALVWLGNLAEQDGALSQASRWYAEAVHYPGMTHCLALRGMGDVALAGGKLDEAHHRFEDVLRACPTNLHGEARQKLAAVARGRGHRALTLLFGAILCATVGLLGWRLARLEVRPRFPRELTFVLPIFALFLLAGLGRGRQLMLALGQIAIGASLLIAASGIAAAQPRRSRFQLLLQTSLVGISNLGIVYLALLHSALLDPLLEGIEAGAR